MEKSYFIILGGYMQIQSFHALYGMVISMSSPDFTRAEHHCLTFEYEVTATQGMPELEVHVRMTDYMLSGEKIWSPEYHTSQNINANVTIWAVKNCKDAPYVFGLASLKLCISILVIYNTIFYFNLYGLVRIKKHLDIGIIDTAVKHKKRMFIFQKDPF